MKSGSINSLASTYDNVEAIWKANIDLSLRHIQ